MAVIALTVPGPHVDVNVHPSKETVKLRNESTIAHALKVSVRETLGRHLHVPSPQLGFALGGSQLELPRMLAERGPEYDVATRDRLRGVRVLGQAHGSLIMVEDATGLYLVDQHRAHERAIYELLRRRHVEGRAGQLLLEPLHIELSSRQIARLEPRLSELAALGFECEWFGGRSFLVRSVPVLPESTDLMGVVEDLLDRAVEDESDWQHRLLTSVACRSATRRGKPLTVEQGRELVELLAGHRVPRRLPPRLPHHPALQREVPGASVQLVALLAARQPTRLDTGSRPTLHSNSCHWQHQCRARLRSSPVPVATRGHAAPIPPPHHIGHWRVVPL